MEEISHFYNINGLATIKCRLGFGSEGAFISFIRFKETHNNLAPNPEFYQVTGVGYNPYNEDMAVEEEKEIVEKNWRDVRRNDKKEKRELGNGEYAWAEDHRPGNVHNVDNGGSGGPGYRMI